MVIVAFVSVPKDLTKVKNKVVLNLTKRQLICLVIAAAVGLPFYFLTREWIGTSNAATGMVILMLPAFMFAMYEKDGLPLEKILLNVIHVKLRYPAIRRYEIENLYEIQETVTTEKRKRGGSGRREKEKEMIDRRTSLISKGRKPMKEAGWMMRTRNIRIMERQKPMIQKKWQAL